MKRQSIKDYYFVIQGWMLEELNLTGCELSLFAIIYGFSQGLNTCDISLSYLSKLSGYSKRGVLNALSKLEKKEYIAILKQTSLLSNKKLRNSYQVLKLPNSEVIAPSNSELSSPLTDIIDILKNNLKINKLNKQELHELKKTLIHEIEELESQKIEIATTKWLDN